MSISLGDKPERPLIRQAFYASALVVPASPSVIQLSQANQQVSLDTLIVAFSISVPNGGANSIWVGDSSITPANFNGTEIVPGVTKTFWIEDTRQLYEIQQPLTEIDTCGADPFTVPLAVWDLSNWYASATAQITVGLMLYPLMFK